MGEGCPGQGSGIDAWVLFFLHLWSPHPESAPPCSPGLPPLPPGLGKGKWSLLAWGSRKRARVSPPGVSELSGGGRALDVPYLVLRSRCGPQEGTQSLPVFIAQSCPWSAQVHGAKTPHTFGTGMRWGVRTSQRRGLEPGLQGGQAGTGKGKHSLAVRQGRGLEVG